MIRKGIKPAMLASMQNAAKTDQLCRPVGQGLRTYMQVRRL